MKRVSITMVAAALLFLLSACVIEPGMDAGRKVAIRFAASNGDEAGDDIVLRSAATATPETQTVSLGGDFFLYATLTPEAADAAGELRAAEPLANGQKVYLSAYEAGTDTHVSTVLYIYTNGNLVAEGGNGLEVETGSTYNFTAYSYYNNTTDTPSATNVDPAKDLIWGQQANKAITAEDQTVSIVMTRRFARAKVRIGTTIPGAAILAPLGNVTITSSYANLSVPDGALTKGADIPHTVTFPDFESTDSIVSNETDTVYPGVKVNIASMIIDVPGQDGTPFTRSDISLGFNSLKGGKSYVLEVSVRQTRWAFSNIYWQAVDDEGDDRYPGYLTFDTTNKGHQGYQGVFFRYGSLVGVSPHTNGSAAYTSDYSTATPVYIPTYVEGGTSTWSAPTTSPYSGWGDIPRLGMSPDFSLTDAEWNTPEMYANLKGDICQYLGKTDTALNGYRMPIWAEYQVALVSWNTETPTSGGWLKGDGNFTMVYDAGYADGRADFLATQKGTSYNPNQPTNGAGMKLGAGINWEMGVVLPASAYRDGSSYLGAIGLVGSYPHASSYTTQGGGPTFLTFNANQIYYGWAQTNQFSPPVRCIRKLPGDP
jgi:hypothetical protein